MVLLSAHQSCTSVLMLMSLCTLNIFNHFLLLRFLKLQYQMKGGKKLSSIIYNTSVNSPSLLRYQPILERCPIETWDFRGMEIVLHFMVLKS